MQRSHILFSALILLSCRAACALDIHQPATIHFTLRDADHHPIPGVRITLARESDSDSPLSPASATTDARGTAEFKREPAPQTDDPQPSWTEHVHIEKEGYLPIDNRPTLFVGAQIETPVFMVPARRTVITVKGPAGQPVARFPLTPWYEHKNPETGKIVREDNLFGPPLHTDEHGQLAWTHGPAVGDLTIAFGARRLRVPDGDQVTITLSAAEYEQNGIPHTLTGKLLLPDGAPAKGWHVGEGPMHDNSFSIGSGIMSISDHYAVDKWQPVQPDGTFTVSFPGERLAVLSPEGLPMLYPTNPSTWNPGMHAVTLTTPPVLRTITGQLLDGANKPLVGFTVAPSDMGDNLRNWSVQIGRAFSDGNMDFQMDIGPSAGRILSDAQGRFSVPIYSHMYFSNLFARNGQGQRYVLSPPIGDDIPSTFMPNVRSIKPQQQMKEITIVFADDAGKVATGPAIAQISPGQNGSLPSFIDTRGTHVFVPATTTLLKVNTAEGEWRAATKLFTIADHGDERLEYPISQLLRFKPIRGRLLDVAGKPIANGYITPFDKSVPSSRGTEGRRYYSSTSTDSEGHFELPGAPDDCKLSASAADADGHSLLFPTDPAHVTADHRNIEIHALPCGVVRILLPLGMPQPRQGYQPIYGEFNAADSSLTYFGLPPGPFPLTADMLAGLAGFTSTTADVVANKTTTVDLRNHPLVTPLPPPSRWTTLTITSAGKPVSGAEVGIFTSNYSPQELAQCLERWKNASPPDEHAAELALYEFGQPAHDALLTLKGDAALQARIDKIRDNGWLNLHDGLKAATLDLSDDAGTVRFLAQPGAIYVAAARIRGQSAGLLKFQIPAQPGAAPTLSLGPVRTVTARNNNNFYFAASVVAADNLERRALTRLLHNDDSWSDGFGPPLHRGAADLRIIEDVPVGTVLEIKPGQTSTPRSVTVTPGDAPLSLDPSPP